MFQTEEMQEVPDSYLEVVLSKLHDTNVLGLYFSNWNAEIKIKK